MVMPTVFTITLCRAGCKYLLCKAGLFVLQSTRLIAIYGQSCGRVVINLDISSDFAASLDLILYLPQENSWYAIFKVVKARSLFM